MRKTYLRWSDVLTLATGVLLASTVFAPTPAEAAQTFNVKKFGATGNGVTDDTSALQAAFAAANAAQGSTILFPQGNYLYSDQLVVTGSGVSVVGQHATLTSESDHAFLALQGANESVNGMTFSTQSSALGAIFVNGATGFEIENNTFNAGFSGFAISVGESSNGEIESNKITLNNNGSAVTLGDTNLVSIQSNAITGPSTSTSTFGFQIGSCNNISVVSNRVNGVGFVLAGGDCSTMSFMHNACTYAKQAVNLGDTQNLTISGNVFTGTSSGEAPVSINGVQNALVSNNTITNGDTGIVAGGGTNIQISGNTLSNIQGPAIDAGGTSTLIASRNTIRQAQIGIIAGGITNLSLNGNQIAQCQQQGIITENCTGTETIFNNQIRSCGLGSTDPAAVIFVDSAGATSIPITHNSYTGNSAGLSFFIRCEQASPPAQVSGNSTNTGLPTVVGP